MANASGNAENIGVGQRLSEPRVLDNQVRVSTPENIAFQYEVTGPSRRLLAYLADVIITLAFYCLISFLISIAFGFLAAWLQGTVFAPLMTLLGEIAGGILLAFAFISLWFYGAYMETNYNGQTFGKMLANIRAISTDGSAIDATQATLRNFFRLMDVSPFISLHLIFGSEIGSDPGVHAPFIPIFAFGLICMVISPRYQRIGDFVAGTIVVTEDRKWTYGLATFQDPRVPGLADLIPQGFVVSPSMAKALAEYVDRRRVLPQQRVMEVAAHLGQPLIREFGLADDTNPDLLLCSLYYRTFIDFKEDGGTPNPFVTSNPQAQGQKQASTNPFRTLAEQAKSAATAEPPTIAIATALESEDSD